MIIERRQVPSVAALHGRVPPLLERIYAARQITDAAELELKLSRLLPPDTLKGMPEAAQLLYQMLQRQGRVLIVSDFDADGATSCALVVRALGKMGFQHVDYIVPDRFAYGYGLSPEIAELALERRPDLVITVDNGISSLEGVERLKAEGIAVLITDHHLPGDQLPDADAIVNPNQPDCGFASKALAGVGVAFYVMLGLRALLRQQGWFDRAGIHEPNLGELLDLVALGTVADLVPLDRNNRILVNEGLRRMRQGRACPGIYALLSVAGRATHSLTASDMGFAVAPRLNAAGRLEDMSIGIACLLTDDPASAERHARELDRLNHERRRIEDEMREQADQALQEMLGELEQRELPAALCLYDAGWHPGVVGILASRLKEQLHRPVFIFAKADEQELKGSARSIEGLHIRDLLADIATRYPGVITRFGGHAMAAGLSLPPEQLPAFQDALQRCAESVLKSDSLQRRLLTDGELPIEAHSLESARMLRDAGPWGQGFPEPVFDGRFRVIQQRLVGEKHLKMVLSADGGVTLIDAIAFNVDRDMWPDASIREVSVVYRLDVNEFRGVSQAQLLVLHLEPV